MAVSSVAKPVKQHAESDKPITAEERALLRNYRELSRWDRNFVFMLLQSLANGKFTETTDRYSWEEILATSDLPRSRKAVRHG